MSKNSKIKKVLTNTIGTLIIPVILYLVIFAIAKLLGKSFGSLNQMWAVFRNSMMISTIAYAFSFTFVSSRMDFSIGSVTICVALMASSIATKLELGVVPMLLLGIIFGVVVCFLINSLYLFMKVPSMVFTLGIVYIFESIGTRINGGTITLKGAYVPLGQVPWLIIIPTIMMIIHYVVFSRTKIGYNLRAMGSNQRIAKTAGVNIPRTIRISSLIAGFFLGVGAIMMVSFDGYTRMQLQMSSVSIMFEAMIVTRIASMISRYSNLSIAIMVSAFCQKMLLTGVVAIGLNPSFSDTVRGCFFLGLVLLDALMEKRKVRKQENKRAEILNAELKAEAAA